MRRRLRRVQVKMKMPRKVKRRRELFADDGTSEGWEEFFDYFFPDEEAARPNLKVRCYCCCLCLCG